MNVDWLREHAARLKEHLLHFEQMSMQLETFYQNSLLHIKDNDTRSAIMEQYSTQLDLQQKAVQRMQELYQRAIDQLTALEAK